MNVQQFVSKWKVIELSEIAVAQSHFIDICTLLGHPSPTDVDPKGEFFTFEMTAEKPDGAPGRADAWYKGKFIWEYKRPGSDLSKAYNQLLLYRESLDNPPLLITSDTHDIIIHTNFTNTAKKIHKIDLERLLTGDGFDLLKNAFYDPDIFKPDETQQHVTEATANTFIDVANSLQQWVKTTNGTHDSERLAHFLIRLLFSLFAEDMNLLPDSLFTKLVNQYKQGTTKHLNDFITSLRQLFSAMRNGGVFGFYRIHHFNGGLFDDDFVPDMPTDIIYRLREACMQNWSNIDPSIFGTLFERIIDVSKRAQLGLHYTSRDDISLIVEPVLMQPLRTKWQTVKQKARDLSIQNKPEEAYSNLALFSKELSEIRVLDPACGSGNFLYVSLQRLLDLQKEVITFATQNALPSIPLTVSPAQLYGIELNPYAHELAQTTVWIGYLQWRFDNGFSDIEEPILRPLHNIEQKDAILANIDHQVLEPEWQEVDVIVGNPPFLGGGRRMREELGHEYVEQLFNLYRGRLPGGADLVCYWFEKARAMIESGKVKRVGLLATQSIRGGASRHVLGRVKQTGDIFMAWSDREWIQEGVMVHVSMIGFDSGLEETKTLNGNHVTVINSSLSSELDLTLANTLDNNMDVCFRGLTKTGPFELTEKQARDMIESKNPSDCANIDVIKPSINALDITSHPRHMWLIDFYGLTLEQAKRYEKPFQYVFDNVKPFRNSSRQKILRDNWWLFERSRPAMRKAISSLNRFIVTPLTSKHRVYVWLSQPTLPDQANYIFARNDDYFFGVLHSSIHEIWVRRKGTQLREAESGSRYSPTETFETFPFPWLLDEEPTENENDRLKAIAVQARNLHAFRNHWLNPEGIGVTFKESIAKRRTLTSLYNAFEHYRESYKSGQRDIKKWETDVKSIINYEDIQELDYIHQELDKSVFNAYGWSYSLTEEEILGSLLNLNLARSDDKD